MLKLTQSRSFYRINSIFCTVIILIVSVCVHAAPYQGDEFKLKQPDGTRVRVNVWGDEYYQRVESIDGYSLVRNEYGWICYAELSPNGDEFIPTDMVYEGIELDRTPVIKQYLQQNRGLKKGLTINPASRKAKAQHHRAQLNKPKTALIQAAPGEATEIKAAEAMTAAAPLTGSVVGLTILIDFPEEPATISATAVDDYCNQIGYTGYGNNGSARDYYDDVSNGLLEYTNIVTGYYTAAHSKDYYNDPSQDYGVRARELLGEALDWLENDQNFDFTQLSTDNFNYILAINVFYVGEPEVGWSVGLWPHASSYYGFTSSSGVKSGRYQISNMGTSLQLGTFCHENGHMICGYPDLYDYGYESHGIGNFGLMAAGGSNTNPVPPNPYLRDLKGWETIIEVNSDTAGTVRTHTANSFTTYRYSHPTNSEEFFLIESRLKTGRNASLPDEGLLIWHIDEAGDNDDEQMTPSQHYMVSVEQADGLFHLENNNNYGSSGDLFHAGYKSVFDDTTLPDATWWDGSNSGLSISGISAVDSTMTFVMFAQETYPPVADSNDYTITNLAGMLIGLNATDDGYPVDPGKLSTIITSLPEHGWLFDPNDGLEIITVPYTLQNDGNSVIYEPCPYYFQGTDGFTFKANDGGTPPDGGDSNIADVNIVMNMLTEVLYEENTNKKDYVPFFTSDKKARSQVIYHADELGGGPITISNLALNIQQVPGVAEIKNWTIRMKHTALTGYPSYGNSFDNEGWTVVYDANEIISTTGWHDFALQNTFAYDGVNNLMIDFSFDNDTTGTLGYVYDSDTPERRIIWQHSGTGDPLEFTTPQSYEFSRAFNLKLKTQPDTEVLYADFNYNCAVGFEDLITMIDTWLAQQGDANYNSDCNISVTIDNTVNLADFAVLAAEWLNAIE